MKNLYKFKSTLILILLVMAGGMVRGQTVTTDYVINITTTGAWCGYTVSVGGTNATGVIVGTSNDPVYGGGGVLPFAGVTGTGSQFIELTGLSNYTTYYARAYATNDGSTYAYGLSIQFKTYPAGTGVFPYQCELRNDYLTDANTLRFDIYIKSTTATLLYLNNYQLGIEVNNVELTAGTLTGTYVSGTTGLADAFKPATNMIFRSHGGHWDAVMPGPPPSSNGEAITQTPGEKRIGTFEIVHHSTSGGPATAFPTGVQLNMVFDFDLLGKTVVYGIAEGTTTGTVVNVTSNTSHIPNEINPNHFYPSNNYMLNALNWKGTTSTDWFTASNWYQNPSTIPIPPISTTFVYIESVGPSFFPVITTRTTPICGGLDIDDGDAMDKPVKLTPMRPVQISPT